MEIREVLAKRASLWNEAKKFLDDHTDKDGKISAEDAATYDKMEADIDAMSKSIERHERNARIGAELDKPFNTPIFEQPYNPFGKVGGKVGRASDEYRRDMIKAMRTGFKTVSNYLNESNEAQGGYLVPTEWDNRLLEKLSEENVVRKLATTITTSTERKIPQVASSPAAAWLDEGAAITFGGMSFGQVTLDAYKLGVGVQISEELLQDNAYDLENHIISEFGKAIANAEEDAFLNGAPSNNVTTRPTGIFVTAGAAGNNPIETAGASIAGNDIIDLVYALKRPYRRKAAFILNDATLAVIRKLKDQNQAYLWQPSYTQGEPDLLFGFPVYSSAYAPTAVSGSAFIAFGDFSYYYIADRGARTIQILREAYAANGFVAFIMKERVDGVLILPEAVKVLKLK